MRLFVDKLSNIDFSFLHPSRGLVGETWLASIELEGSLDEQGMVVDFGRVKSLLRSWLDQELDHKLLVPANATQLTIQEQNLETEIQWQFTQGRLIYRAPNESHCLINSDEISKESVARWCIETLKPHFPDSVEKLTLRFESESLTTPFYHYSHGLKKHGGNCQRIAHGHRSPIYIWRNDDLSVADMERWSQQWQDIYIGTGGDCVEALEASNTGFRYVAPQGEFYLELPTELCYLIDTDSTIEFIAQHIAQTLKAETPEDKITVKAFEGLAKGAIVTL